MILKYLSFAIFLQFSFLSGCTTNTKITEPIISIAQKQEQLIGYFNTKYEFSEQKIHNGYFRKLLGRTAEGKLVVQDFYAINGRPASSAYSLTDDDTEDVLKIWGSWTGYSDSSIIFYFGDGRISDIRLIPNDSKPKQYINFHHNGKVFSENTYNKNWDVIRTRYFDENGKLLKDETVSTDNEGNILDDIYTYYDSNGKILIANEDNYEAIENINAKVTQLMGDLSKLNMKLAGQAKCLKSNVC